MRVADAYGYPHTIMEWDQDFEIVLPWLKPWGNSRMHWRQESKLKKEQKRLTMLQLLAQAVRPQLPCTIILQRVSTGSLDPSNVCDCLKYPQDEIARWMGLKSDHVPGLSWRYGQQRTSRKGFVGVRVTIIEGDRA